MKRMFRFSILEMMVVIAIILIIMSMVMPVLELVRINAQKTKAQNSARSIGLTLIAYAEDDVKSFKMPYPIPKTAKLVPWGSDNCLTRHVVEMLFEQNYMKLGEEGQLTSAGATAQGYEPIVLLDDVAKKTDKFWKPVTTCDFQVYCEKSLTSNVSGKKILVATFDGLKGEFKEAQFAGSGWVVFYADKTTGFIKRLNQRDYDADLPSDLIEPKDTAAITAKGGVLLSKIITDGGGTAKAGSGGGSTELMGKKETDIAYQALVR